MNVMVLTSTAALPVLAGLTGEEPLAACPFSAGLPALLPLLSCVPQNYDTHAHCAAASVSKLDMDMAAFMDDVLFSHKTYLYRCPEARCWTPSTSCWWRPYTQ